MGVLFGKGQHSRSNGRRVLALPSQHALSRFITISHPCPSLLLPNHRIRVTFALSAPRLPSSRAEIRPETPDKGRGELLRRVEDHWGFSRSGQRTSGWARVEPAGRFFFSNFLHTSQSDRESAAEIENKAALEARGTDRCLGPSSHCKDVFVLPRRACCRTFQPVQNSCP